MRIFGHRGAAGLALENSHDSVLAGLAHNIEAMEFDVHRTRDGKIVVVHDHHTGRVAHRKASVHDLTLAELETIPLSNGQRIMTLDALLTIIGDKKPVMIDIKDRDCADELVRIFARHPKATIYCTSFKHDNLEKLHTLRPDIRTYVLKKLRPFSIITSARRLGASGVSVKLWLMNPLTYHLAKRHNLELLIYTINHPKLMRLFTRWYPDAVIYTDHPDRFAGPAQVAILQETEDGTTTARPSKQP